MKKIANSLMVHFIDIYPNYSQALSKETIEIKVISFDKIFLYI